MKKDAIVAVVGATTNREKWGYKVYKALKGYYSSVFPVNPKYKSIDLDRCYPDVSSLPERPDIVVTVVPPRITEDVVKSCYKLGIKSVWMQPGSESKEAIDFCRKNNIDVVYNACLVVDGLKIGFDKDE